MNKYFSTFAILMALSVPSLAVVLIGDEIIDTDDFIIQQEEEKLRESIRFFGTLLTACE